MKPVIEVQNISKRYLLGNKTPKTLQVALNSIWRKSENAKFDPLTGKGESAPGSDIFWALKEINFSIAQGEVVGIIGKNGSGKSTLMKILSRITEPTIGKVALRGQAASILEVGTGFHPDLTGRENIYLNGAILGMRQHEIRSRFDEIVNFSGVETFIDTAVKHYSSGMYLRLAFSVAAYLRAEILMIDEVLAVGDMEFQQKCLKRIVEITKEGKTIIFVTHNLRHVTDICSRGFYMSQGNIVYDGNPHLLIEKYVKSVEEKNIKTFSGMEHYAHSEDMEIEKADLKNSREISVQELLFKEPFTVRLEVNVRRALKKIRIGAGFSTLTDIWIGRAHYPNAKNETVDLLPGRYTLNFFFQNCLWPGSYYLGLGAHQVTGDGNRDLDYVPRAILFSVKDLPADPEIAEPPPHNYGLVELAVKSSIEAIK